VKQAPLPQLMSPVTSMPGNGYLSGGNGFGERRVEAGQPDRVLAQCASPVVEQILQRARAGEQIGLVAAHLGEGGRMPEWGTCE
jgi:hypothetical protein